MIYLVGPLRKRWGTYAISPSAVNVAIAGGQGGFDRLANFFPAGLPDTCRTDDQTRVNQDNRSNQNGEGPPSAILGILSPDGRM